MVKFLLKLFLALTAVTVACGWYFYEKYQPSAAISKNPLVINDVTGLNPIPVSLVLQPRSELDITDAIMATSGPISIGGARYSMGGQIAYPDSLHLDMRKYNKILSLDTDNKRITVEPGITWREIQQAIDPHDLSVMIMQDFNNFTVGGSLSVNAHGRYSAAGPIINSVESIRIALANGQVYNASATENNALFHAAIGGYGGIGVITEATLQLTDNIPIERFTQSMRFVDFVDYFTNNILQNEKVVLHNALLYPPAFEDVLDITWRTTDKPLTETRRLRSYDPDQQIKPMLVDLVSRFYLLKQLRRNLVDRTLYSRPAVVMKNWETSYDLREFGIASDAESTMALREYFVPLDNFEVFVLKMRDAFIRHDVNVLNISIRYSPRDRNSLLAWAKEDMLAFVVIYRQGKDQEARDRVSQWSRELIDSAVGSGGSYYLPFQVQESSEQFFKVYPRAHEYFALKRKVDPENRFNNMLLNKHLPKAQEKLSLEQPSPYPAWPRNSLPGNFYNAYSPYHAAGR